MWYEIFKFEIHYRLKRPETYFFFLFLFCFSLIGVDFVFQGIDLGPVKKNAPIVIAKSMGAITGLSLFIASMVMGVPVLRDFQYQIAGILYSHPISKKHYLIGRFLGSLVILLFIFSGILSGMILGETMPWITPNDYEVFHLQNYLQPFLWVALPIVLFGAILFFITGALSKKLLVVYTQGIFVFVLFMLTKAITNESLQSILDPFSLTTLSEATKDWNNQQRNHQLIPMNGILLYRNLFWFFISICIGIYGYYKFKLNSLTNKAKKLKKAKADHLKSFTTPKITSLNFGTKSQIKQLLYSTWFYMKSIIKETSFIAIIICSFIIIIVNSVNLGTTYGVDSLPTSYLIVEELQEMSMYFFMILLIFYSAELMHKEKENHLNLIHDATPTSSFIIICSKYFALLGIYSILILCLIAAGVLFQTFSTYFQYDLHVYLTGFFLEIFPFLALYTLVAIFFQAVTNHKFLAIIFTLVLLITNVVINIFIIDHPLINFGGNTLVQYSEMNAYGHFLNSFLWIKTYWSFFGILLLIAAAIINYRGINNTLKKRWKTGVKELQKPIKHLSLVSFIFFIIIGVYIFYNTNIINSFWTPKAKETFRVSYEKNLKKFEYFNQPKIINTKLSVDLLPSKRSYTIKGEYLAINPYNTPIHQIHIQKYLDDDTQLKKLVLHKASQTDSTYKHYGYTIYKLSEPIKPGDSIKISFLQNHTPKGFKTGSPNTTLVHNGTFFNNEVLPSFGYHNKYELRDTDTRKQHGLSERKHKAKQNDKNELYNARTGSDSNGTLLDVIISTEAPQTAITSGRLIKKWTQNNLNYFHYKTPQPIINFYAFVSANYKQLQKQYTPKGNSKTVSLEIYHHDKHDYNTNRMLLGLQESLDYYSTNFGEYQYEQLRIAEFPRYREFAQSFPSVIPFSEALGFILAIDDKKDVDMSYYITAHEVAHQWWGLQLEAANVQGKNMILETLSQYSAMMVLKKKYGTKKLQQFLDYQLETYKTEKRKQKQEEVPLALVTNESHIYYAKGAIAMYTLQQAIGETKVNKALRSFLQDWKTTNHLKQRQYATTKNLISYLRKVGSDEQQALITKLFEEVHSLENI